MERTNNTPAWMRVAEVELVYKTTVKATDRPKILQSADAYSLLIQHWDAQKIELLEQFKILLLNRAHNVLGIFQVSSGGMTGTVADPKIIFAAALKACACNLILCHNHPSGNLQPSREDELFTQRLVAGAKLLDMRITDHLIITAEGYFSFADQGLL